MSNAKKNMKKGMNILFIDDTADDSPITPTFKKPKPKLKPPQDTDRSNHKNEYQDDYKMIAPMYSGQFIFRQARCLKCKDKISLTMIDMTGASNIPDEDDEDIIKHFTRVCRYRR